MPMSAHQSAARFLAGLGHVLAVEVELVGEVHALVVEGREALDVALAVVDPRARRLDEDVALLHDAVGEVDVLLPRVAGEVLVEAHLVEDLAPVGHEPAVHVLEPPHVLRRGDALDEEPAAHAPAGLRPPAAHAEELAPEDRRLGRVGRVDGRPAHAAELGAPALVLGEDLFVHVRVEPDVVVDQEDGVAARPVDTGIALHGEAARRRVDVVEADARRRAELLDLLARRGLVARVDDAELLREDGLRHEALDRVAEEVRPVPRRDDEGRAGPLSLGLRCAHGTRRHDRTVVPCART